MERRSKYKVLLDDSDYRGSDPRRVARYLTDLAALIICLNTEPQRWGNHMNSIDQSQSLASADLSSASQGQMVRRDRPLI